ncbi:hypothetical protein FGB62_25g259 [Gracilaria domingensis]|nr:hypothetical protein FGB62_25g259 [Gracilaria domingensis]
MGRNRRSSKAQGIRKKKASKQTLVKVAERRERKQQKIETAILARQGVRKSTFVGGVSNSNQSLEVEESQDYPLLLEEDEDPQGRAVARKVKNRQSIYQSLLVSLKSDSKPTNGETIRATHADNDQHLEEPIHSSTIEGVREDGSESAAKEKGETDAINSTEPSLKRLMAENIAAAVRENRHFRSDIVPQDIELKTKVLGTFAGLGRVSASVPHTHFPAFSDLVLHDFAGIDDVKLGMRPSLFEKWKTMMETEFPETPGMKGRRLSKLHRAFIAVVREYRDILLCAKYSRTDDDLLRKLYTVHCLSHVLRCGSRVLRNDYKLINPPEGWEVEKDQGFCRARVLILLPMKNLAYEVVKSLQALAVGVDDSETDVSQIANKDRFESEFAPDVTEDEDEDHGIGGNDDHSLTGKKRRKPEDYRRTFRGNIDDDFKLGIAFTKKSMKLYNDFYSSDIIIASPLGLRRLLAEKASGKDIEAKLEKQRKEEAVEWRSKIGSETGKPKVEGANSDFLSSIEICVIDGLHIFSMQNWETLQQTVSMMNQVPSSTRDTDFSRVRDWCLDGLMRKFRQTIVLSEYRKSEFVSMFRRLSNHNGKVQVVQAPREHGTTTDVIVSARQTFFKLPDVDSPLQALDTRLEFFFDNVLPQLRSFVNSRSIIVVPAYFDYVRVRNRLVALASEDPSIRFTSMCEYSKPNEVSRARSMLFDGSVSMVLMTERFHFYWRYWIRGANTLVWYSLPENAIFYPELLNMTAEAAESGQAVHSIALYNSYDSFSLERIVGNGRCKKMVSKQSRSMYLFV